MKNCFTFFTLLLGISVFAQSKMFVHTATSDNSSGAATMLDHPDFLNINSEKPIQKIQVMNMAGQIVHEGGEDSSINMQNLPKGLYIVHIYTPNQMQSKKVIKE